MSVTHTRLDMSGMFTDMLSDNYPDENPAIWNRSPYPPDPTPDFNDHAGAVGEAVQKLQKAIHDLVVQGHKEISEPVKNASLIAGHKREIREMQQMHDTLLISSGKDIARLQKYVRLWQVTTVLCTVTTILLIAYYAR